MSYLHASRALGTGAAIVLLSKRDSGTKADWEPVSPLSSYSVYRGEQNWEYDWDKRHSKFLELEETCKSKSEISRGTLKHRIIMVRHGQYVYSPTDKGRILTELGREQAELAGQRIGNILQNDASTPPLQN